MSVKNTEYKVGQKVYYSEGVEEKYFIGTITKSMKTCVRIKTKDGIITKEKRNLGIVI